MGHRLAVLALREIVLARGVVAIFRVGVGLDGGAHDAVGEVGIAPEGVGKHEPIDPRGARGREHSEAFHHMQVERDRAEERGERLRCGGHDAIDMIAIRQGHGDFFAIVGNSDGIDARDRDRKTAGLHGKGGRGRHGAEQARAIEEHHHDLAGSVGRGVQLRKAGIRRAHERGEEGKGRGDFHGGVLCLNSVYAPACAGGYPPFVRTRRRGAYFAASAASMAWVRSADSGVTFESYQWMSVPSRPTRNLLKFHVILPGEAGRAGEGGVEWVAAIAIHLDLVKQREGDAEFGGAELLDLIVGAGLLLFKLVAREAEDHEAFVLVFRINGFEAGVLRGEAALGGDIHHEDHLAFVSGEGWCPCRGCPSPGCRRWNRRRSCGG